MSMPKSLLEVKCNGFFFWFEIQTNLCEYLLCISCPIERVCAWLTMCLLFPFLKLNFSCAASNSELIALPYAHTIARKRFHLAGTRSTNEHYVLSISSGFTLSRFNWRWQSFHAHVNRKINKKIKSLTDSTDRALGLARSLAAIRKNSRHSIHSSQWKCMLFFFASSLYLHGNAMCFLYAAAERKQREYANLDDVKERAQMLYVARNKENEIKWKEIIKKKEAKKKKRKMTKSK